MRQCEAQDLVLDFLGKSLDSSVQHVARFQDVSCFESFAGIDGDAVVERAGEDGS